MWSFGLCSEHATAVTLELYAPDQPRRPLHRVPLEPSIWDGEHGAVRLWTADVSDEVVAGAELYAYRVDGPDDPSGGHRFDAQKVLIDPYAREIVFPESFSRAAAQATGDNAGQAPLGVLPARGSRRWPPAPRPRHPLHELVVYELHVRGFTRRESSGVLPPRRGTFAGLVGKIPYLLDLGVTAVELMPVFQFDPQEGNYWGYMPMSFFAPHRGYGRDDPTAELVSTVAAFHRAGIEVWLDVVYNHTAEGDETGPTYSLRGIDNAGSYLLEAEDRSRYRNDSGTGNVLACARPAVAGMVLDSLRYWAEEIGVAGFRFDLATLLARDAEGRLEETPGLLEQIRRFAEETGVRVIAEPWDLGAYRLGESFPSSAWWQWNGAFRDTVRSFVRGDAGLEREVALRLGGSPDLFPPQNGDWSEAGVPVNYVTCHDGFNLWDLVSYNHKRNRANGWDNRDGPADDRSWNCGWEGDEGAPPEVLALRQRQARNLVCLLLLSSGVPMLLAGDEFLHTRGGNNNPYNQDNETTWLDWLRLERHADFHGFVRRLIVLRKAHPGLARPWGARAAWFGANGTGGERAGSQAVACHLPASLTGTTAELFVAANSASEPRSFDLPPAAWRRVVDTSAARGDEIRDYAAAATIEGRALRVAERSVCVLRYLP